MKTKTYINTQKKWVAVFHDGLGMWDIKKLNNKGKINQREAGGFSYEHSFGDAVRSIRHVNKHVPASGWVRRSFKKKELSHISTWYDLMAYCFNKK